MNTFEYLKLHVVMECMEECFLPPYLGSTLRGTMGNVLRELSCSTGKEECAACGSKSECPYTKCFSYHNSENEGWMKGVETKPNPFVIEPPLVEKTEYKINDEIDFDILLFEQAAEYMPYFLYSLEKMALRGFGAKRSKFRLVSIEDAASGKKLYYNEHFDIHEPELQIWKDDVQIKAVTELKMNFITPFRYKMEGKLYDSINFEVIMRNIFRRASILAASYGKKEWELEYKGYLEMSRGITVKKADLKWNDLERYSNRTKSKMKMGGIEGEIIFRADITPFMPYIKLGCIIHIGKGCTMGLGKYDYEILG